MMLVRGIQGSETSISVSGAFESGDTAINFDVYVENVNSQLSSLLNSQNERIAPKASVLMEKILVCSVEFHFSAVDLLEEKGKDLSDAMQEFVMLGYALLSEDEEIEEKLMLLKEFIDESKDVYDPVGEYGKDLGYIFDELQGGMKSLTGTHDELATSGAERDDNDYDYSAYDYHGNVQNNWSQESYEAHSADDGEGSGEGSGEGFPTKA